ncbi:hypothetical protein VTO42DRAFT_2836 [Malbranchea cinnamomea]
MLILGMDAGRGGVVDVGVGRRMMTIIAMRAVLEVVGRGTYIRAHTGLLQTLSKTTTAAATTGAPCARPPPNRYYLHVRPSRSAM